MINWFLLIAIFCSLINSSILPKNIHECIACVKNDYVWEHEDKIGILNTEGLCKKNMNDCESHKNICVEDCYTCPEMVIDTSICDANDCDDCVILQYGVWCSYVGTIETNDTNGYCGIVHSSCPQNELFYCPPASKYKNCLSCVKSNWYWCKDTKICVQSPLLCFSTRRDVVFKPEFCHDDLRNVPKVALILLIIGVSLLFILTIFCIFWAFRSRRKSARFDIIK